MPEEGDLSLCIKCGGFLQYGKGLTLIKMPDKIWDDLDQETFDSLLEGRKHILKMKEVGFELDER